MKIIVFKTINENHQFDRFEIRAQINVANFINRLSITYFIALNLRKRRKAYELFMFWVWSSQSVAYI